MKLGLKLNINAMNYVEKQQNGYHIYGLDILVRDNLAPVMLECNNQTGLSSSNEIF